MAALHPALVHFPIVLALLWPVVDLLGVLTRNGGISRLAVGLLGATVVASLAATLTGQAALDDAVMQGFSGELLAEHADRASGFPWLVILVLAVRLGAAARLGRKGQVLGLAFGVAMAPFVFSVARSGGRLVYDHGVGVSTIAPNRSASSSP